MTTEKSKPKLSLAMVLVSCREHAMLNANGIRRHSAKDSVNNEITMSMPRAIC